MNQIIYGVGRTIIKDFADKTKVIGLSKLKNVNVEMTANSEPIVAGDNPYPFASFPRDKAIRVTAENATFDLKLFNSTQGGNITKGTRLMTDLKTVIIPEDGVVELVDGLVNATVEGFTKGDTVLSAKQFTLGESDITFHEDDAGTEVDIIFDYNSSADAETLSGTKDALAKPVEFIHVVDIYDDNNAIVAKGQLIIYKAKSNNAWTFGLQPQTAYAPTVEYEAQDAKRPDGKLWDFIVDPVK